MVEDRDDIPSEKCCGVRWGVVVVGYRGLGRMDLYQDCLGAKGWIVTKWEGEGICEDVEGDDLGCVAHTTHVGSADLRDGVVISTNSQELVRKQLLNNLTAKFLSKSNNFPKRVHDKQVNRNGEGIAGRSEKLTKTGQSNRIESDTDTHKGLGLTVSLESWAGDSNQAVHVLKTIQKKSEWSVEFSSHTVHGFPRLQLNHSPPYNSFPATLQPFFCRVRPNKYFFRTLCLFWPLLSSLLFPIRHFTSLQALNVTTHPTAHPTSFSQFHKPIPSYHYWL